MITTLGDIPPPTVTRKVFRTSRFSNVWHDMWIIRDEQDRTVRSIVTVAMMEIGPALDRETFAAHLALGNDGAAMRDGKVIHYFEHDDIMNQLAGMWADCTLHPVIDIKEIWDEQRRDDLGPPPIAIT